MRDSTVDLFSPIENDLPATYRRDAESWQQIREFFAPFNQLLRNLLTELDELPQWLSPAAAVTLPPGLYEAVDGEEFARKADLRRAGTLDEVASWFGHRFEPLMVWEVPEDDGALAALVRDKAHYLQALPSIRRERGTPHGFLREFCFTFRLDPADANVSPVLVEHFQYREREPEAETSPASADGGSGVRCGVLERAPREDGIARRASLLLSPAAFGSFKAWSAAVSWLDRNAPLTLALDAHVVTARFWRELHRDWLHRSFDVRDLVRAVEQNVLHSEALHAVGSDLAAAHELNLGRLPSDFDDPQAGGDTGASQA